MWPVVGCSKPAIKRRQVVLPEPDGPSMAKTRPAGCEVDRVDAFTAPKWSRHLFEGTAEVM